MSWKVEYLPTPGASRIGKSMSPNGVTPTFLPAHVLRQDKFSVYVSMQQIKDLYMVYKSLNRLQLVVT